MTILLKLLNTAAGLAFAPLLIGVINRTKAWCAGRTGPPLLQPYHDLRKLFRKGAVYSESSSWILRAGPVVGLSAVVTAATIIPFGGLPVLLSFNGDLILFAYLFGLARFFTILMALDSGSSFEGMGASREAAFSALAEPVLLLTLAVIAKYTGQISFSKIFPAIDFGYWPKAGPAFVLIGLALLIVFLAENARIPIDDPNTHLELTMIHEVMVLDHSGPDLGMIHYAAAVKMWLLGTLLTGIIVPVRGGRP
ncbi:MAG TPA: NADH-quinone oxidoreductase subunit H, partial [Candidatus Aminicenantes bacterium]|nr:NADH-quinone oxidoreductase subunit H [Candidatus Aminicenantes bacterium]